MDIQKRRDELVAEMEKGKQIHAELSNKISVIEANIKRIEGAILLCDEMLNDGEKITTETEMTTETDKTTEVNS